MTTETSAARRTKNQVAVPVVLDYLLSHLGFYCLLPVLPVLLGRMHQGVGPLLIGTSLFTFTFTYKGASLFCAGLLQRLPIRLAIPGGLTLAGLGFALLPLSPHPLVTLLFLVVAGVGISVNGITARMYVAMALESAGERNSVFAGIQVAINVSAAVGPIVANFLVDGPHEKRLLLLVAAIYWVSAAVMSLCVPSGLRPGDGDARKPLRLGLIKAMVTDRRVRTVSLVTLAGSFLYGQFFSAFAIHVTHIADSATARASFFTLNAVLIVVLQMAVSAFTNRGLERGASPMRFLVLGIAVFAAAFVPLGASTTALTTAYLAVVLFSVAEMLFTPMVSTAFAEFGSERPMVEVFNFRQVASTAGESLGGFAGGALFTYAAQHGAGGAYWWGVAAVGTVVPVAALARARRRAEPAGAGAGEQRPEAVLDGAS
ncbi:MFS transporter [Streptomyces sp. NPDC126499]|uniref:MFS transporter n=1 Tax=Streptomyces sp. NPDC126499 TaxID=3155314 RepID=UPI0033225774